MTKCNGHLFHHLHPCDEFFLYIFKQSFLHCKLGNEWKSKFKLLAFHIWRAVKIILRKFEEAEGFIDAGTTKITLKFICFVAYFCYVMLCNLDSLTLFTFLYLFSTLARFYNPYANTEIYLLVQWCHIFRGESKLI